MYLLPEFLIRRNMVSYNQAVTDDKSLSTKNGLPLATNKYKTQ
jgi:hypothetical protein